MSKRSLKSYFQNQNSLKIQKKIINVRRRRKNGIFHPWGDWRNFSIGENNFRFSCWDYLITEWAKDGLCNKLIETWKLKILWANWNDELKSPGMKYGFLIQNKLYFILKTSLASAFSFQLTQNICHNNEESSLWLENLIFFIWIFLNLHFVAKKIRYIGGPKCPLRSINQPSDRPFDH